MSCDNWSSVSQNVLKFYQLLTGEESRIPFIFEDFHFCRFRVIGLDMTENRIFTLCRMIAWVVFLRMFSNFISSLPVKRGGSLSFLTIFTFAVPELLDLIWRKIGFLCYVVKVITKLPNSEQSYKGKVKTHNYINRQNQSTTGKLWKP